MTNPFVIPEPIRAIVSESGSIVDVEAMESGRSGASVWKVQTSAKAYCVRRWPLGVGRDRLSEIEHFVRHVRGAGVGELPVPLADPRLPYRDTDGRLWSVEAWMPGKAFPFVDTESVAIADGEVRSGDRDASEARIRSAVELLARVHRASHAMGVSREVPLAVRSRASRLAELRGNLEALRPRIAANPRLASAWRAVARHCDGRLDVLLKQFADRLAERRHCQWVIRDIHRMHVLYEGETATALIDFDAVRIDTPTTDLARLLGSLVGDSVSRFRGGVEAYFAINGENDGDRQLIDQLDHATTLCAAVYWIDLLVENDDKVGWQLLCWHLYRLAHFSYGWSRGEASRGMRVAGE